MKKTLNKLRAFTLIEILMVLIIIAILSILGFYTFDGFQEKAKTAYGYQFSPEIKAWAPAELLGSVGDIVSPYAKVGYTFDALSNYRLEAKNEQGTTVKYDGEVNAYYIGIGTAVSVTENISALVDYTYSDGNVQFKNTTTKIKSKKDYLTTHSFMIGARISV